MTQDQIWAAIVVAALYVASVLIRLVGDTINDLMRGRTKKIAAKLEEEAVDVQSKTETERMGIQYMQTLVRDNAALKEENKKQSIENARLDENIRLREETLKQINSTREAQLATQSELKIEAIRTAATNEQRAIKAEALLAETQTAFNECSKQQAQYTTELATLVGKYSELHKEVTERREEFHEERNAWQVLDSARQTEVQRARFVMRHLNSELNETQRIGIQRACAAKGFDYDQYVEVAGSLEMAEIEDLRKQNEELKARLASPTPPTS